MWCLPFHSGGSVHRVPKQLKTSTVSTQYSSRDRAAIKAKAHREVPSVRAQCDLKFARHLEESYQTILSEFTHDQCMVFLRLR
jgi:putative component of membrane protein insertase Oxa1/YidC/SpoIIIJ protein YidD